MNYRVLIPNSIKREIAQLPPDLPIQVLKRLLSELPSDPNRYLGEVVVPFARRAYTFSVQDKTGKRYWVVVHIHGLDPASKPDLQVVGFRCVDFDPDADAGTAPTP